MSVYKSPFLPTIEAEIVGLLRICPLTVADLAKRLGGSSHEIAMILHYMRKYNEVCIVGYKNHTKSIWALTSMEKSEIDKYVTVHSICQRNKYQRAAIGPEDIEWMNYWRQKRKEMQAQRGRV